MRSKSRNASSGPHTADQKAVRVAPAVDPEAAQIERNLALSYSERLDQLLRTVAFIRAGRAALSRGNA